MVEGTKIQSDLGDFIKRVEVIWHDEYAYCLLPSQFVHLDNGR